jgi:phosphate transport system ATP-binding protein
MLTTIPTLDAHGVGLAYDGRPVLAGVDLALPPGSITALVGPSGCGKTSFLQCCNRMWELVPGARGSGEIRLSGQCIRELDPRLLRRRVGMLFQRPNPFPGGIAANIELALIEHGLDDRPRRVESALRAVGLWDEVKDRLRADARRLSGGQQQRLCLARALALEPELLLLDEPCSALDPLATETIEHLLRGLRGRITVLIVTHHLAQARRLADRVALFWPRGGVGTCIEHAATAPFFTAPLLPETAAYVRGERG